MAANQGSYNDVPFNPAPVMDVPSFPSSNQNQMPPTHFQPQEQHVQNNVHNVEPVAQNNQYSNPQVSKNKSVRPIPSHCPYLYPNISYYMFIIYFLINNSDTLHLILHLYTLVTPPSESDDLISDPLIR